MSLELLLVNAIEEQQETKRCVKYEKYKRAGSQNNEEGARESEQKRKNVDYSGHFSVNIHFNTSGYVVYTFRSQRLLRLYTKPISQVFVIIQDRYLSI